MKVMIRDKQAEKMAWAEQERLGLECPYAVPNYIAFNAFSCYREVETQDLFFDENGNLGRQS